MPGDGAVMNCSANAPDACFLKRAISSLIGPHHQYPDGAVLFLGTMFAPVKDRDAPGMGFTHHPGDVVRIAADKLGALTNVVTTFTSAPSLSAAMVTTSPL